MKQQADRRWRPAPTYRVGQRVWLSTKDIPIRGGTRKLAPRYVGPFTITHVISPTAVRLRLPSTMSCIHPTFHISRLKPAVTHALASAPVGPPPPRVIGGGETFTVRGGFWTSGEEDEVSNTSSIGRATAPSTGRGRLHGSYWTRT